MTPDATCARLARWRLDAEPGPALPTAPLDDRAFDALLAATRAERLQGLLAWQLADGSFPATVAQRDRAFAAHRRAMAACLGLERRLLTLADELRRAGIAFRVLKGPAVAHLDELDPSLRVFGDLDLLVDAADLPATQRLLTGLGARRRYPEPRPGFDVRFGKGSCLVLPDATEVDLHRTLALGPFGLTIPLGRLGAGAATFRLAGVDLPALDRAGRFLHACFHAVLGAATPRLAQLRDVALTCPTAPAELLDVLALATEAEAEVVVAEALDATTGLLGWRPPPPVAAWRACLTPDRRARRRLAAYHDRRSSAALALASLGALPWRDRLAYGRAVLLPAPGATRRPRTERVQRAVRDVRRSR